MTEQDWLEATDPQTMLEFLRTTGKLTDRKARLFAVACCRNIWPLLSDERSRTAVEVAERYADGLATGDDLWQSFTAAADLADELGKSAHAVSYRTLLQDLEVAQAAALAAAINIAAEAQHAADAVAWTTARNSWFTFVKERQTDEALQLAKAAEDKQHCDILWDVFGNPFRPLPAIDAAVLAWNSGAVVQLAREVYEANAWERMGDLGGMLEQVGCRNQDALGHCREQGQVHVRGCWLVDRLLGKE